MYAAQTHLLDVAVTDTQEKIGFVSPIAAVELSSEEVAPSESMMLPSTSDQTRLATLAIHFASHQIQSAD